MQTSAREDLLRPSLPRPETTRKSGNARIERSSWRARKNRGNEIPPSICFPPSFRVSRRLSQVISSETQNITRSTSGEKQTRLDEKHDFEFFDQLTVLSCFATIFKLQRKEHFRVIKNAKRVAATCSHNFRCSSRSSSKSATKQGEVDDC